MGEVDQIYTSMRDFISSQFILAFKTFEFFYIYSAYIFICLFAYCLFSGTYGNRQVLSVETNGPFTHVFDF